MALGLIPLYVALLAAFVHLYGGEAELKLVERISRLEAEHRALLAQLPPEAQAHYWARHKQASAEEGADRWCFPAPIFDEGGYRWAAVFG